MQSSIGSLYLPPSWQQHSQTPGPTPTRNMLQSITCNQHHLPHSHQYLINVNQQQNVQSLQPPIINQNLLQAQVQRETQGEVEQDQLVGQAEAPVGSQEGPSEGEANERQNAQLHFYNYPKSKQRKVEQLLKKEFSSQSNSPMASKSHHKMRSSVQVQLIKSKLEEQQISNPKLQISKFVCAVKCPIIPEQKMVPPHSSPLLGHKSSVRTQQPWSLTRGFQRQLQKLGCQARVVQNSKEKPYSAVGLVRITFSKEQGQSQRRYGSGIILGQKFVITAAHIVYDIQHRSIAAETYYFPYGDQQGGGYRVQSYHIPPAYRNQSQYTKFTNDTAYVFDYAILILDTEDDLEEQYGSFNYDFNWQTTYQHQPASNSAHKISNAKLLGYLPHNGIYKLVEFQGEVLEHKQCLFSQFYTKHGVSGGAYLLLDNDDYWVIGIHLKSMFRYPGAKKGIVLGQAMLQDIQTSLCYEVNKINLNNLGLANQLMDVLVSVNIYVMSQRIQANKKHVSAEFNNLTAQSCHLWPELQNVETLNLSNNRIGDEGCSKLTKNYSQESAMNHNNQPEHSRIEQDNRQERKQQNKCLKQLYIYNNTIGALGCKFIANAGWLALIILKLSWNAIGPEGCSYLAQGQFSRLQKLYLSHCEIVVEGMKNLVKAKWENLQQIYLSGNMIGDIGCQYLAQAKWQHLKIINLSRNGITSQGCGHLSEGGWRYLKELYLAMNSIDQEGCKYLSQACNTKWKRLKILGLFENHMKMHPKKYGFSKELTIEWNKSEVDLSERNSNSLRDSPASEKVQESEAKYRKFASLSKKKMNSKHGQGKQKYYEI